MQFISLLPIYHSVNTMHFNADDYSHSSHRSFECPGNFNFACKAWKVLKRYKVLESP